MTRDVLRPVYSDTTQLNSTQLTQLNSVQPISAKQINRVFVYDEVYFVIETEYSIQYMTYKLSQLRHYVH